MPIGAAAIRSERGFTLVEVVLVVVLLSLFGALFGLGFVASTRATLAVDTRKEALQNARVALDRMAREVRMIRSATAADITTTIPTASDLQFTDTYGNAIQFQLTGGNILRNADILAGNVTALTFSYLKNDGTAAASEAEIWRIVMDLTVTVGTESVQLRTEVHPANFS